MELVIFSGDECRKLYRDIAHLVRTTGEVMPPGSQGLIRQAPGGNFQVIRGAGFRSPLKWSFGKIVYLEELQPPTTTVPMMGVSFGDRKPKKGIFEVRMSYIIGLNGAIALSRGSRSLRAEPVKQDTGKDLQRVLNKLQNSKRLFGVVRSFVTEKS